jgi:ribose transport system permease protein
VHEPGALTRRAASLPLLQVAALGALFVAGTIAVEGYSTETSIKAMLVLASFLGIAAIGQTLAILLGGIDLSVPFIIGAANVMVAHLSGGEGWSFAIAAAFVLGLAAAVGAVNGYLSERFGIHPLIVTLALGSVVSGAVLVATDAKVTGSSPEWLGRFVSPAQDTWVIPLPPVVALWALLALVVAVVMSRTGAGRRLYATGANPAAAELALTRTGRVWTGAFAASAACSALAGILLSGFSGAGQFAIGNPYLFTTIAAVVIGGTSLLGARGDYFRTVLGALILIEITTILAGVGFDVPLQQVALGILIVAVVALYGREPTLRSRI